MAVSAQKVGKKSDSSQIANRLRKRMAEVGVSAVELAKLADIKPSFIYDIMHGKSANPSVVKLARVAEQLDTDLSYFIEVRESAGGVGVRLAGDLFSPPMVEGGELNEAHEAQKVAGIVFSRKWAFERLGAKPENLRLVVIKGDSMEPTFTHNDIALFDVTKNFPSPSGIYVVSDGFSLVVKRLELLPSQKSQVVRVISDNEKYESYVKPLPELSIAGRVVWFSREI